MKSQERHRLETNTMAQHLAVWIDQVRPYATTIAGIVLFVFIAMFAWSYLSSSSAAWQSQAWDQYNQAIGQYPLPKLELLRQSAEEHPGTKMQEMADATWADGQVWMASREFLYNRTGAMQALDRAANAYESILQSSDDERLLNRARMGLARVYEMRGEIDRAREQYGAVTGAYADLAKARAEALGREKTKETCAWLATAEPPRTMMPTGPGTPGQSPAFSAGDVPLPSGTSPAGGVQSGAGEGASLDALLQGLNLEEDAADSAERYPADETPATEGAPPESTPPTTEAEQPKE